MISGNVKQSEPSISLKITNVKLQNSDSKVIKSFIQSSPGLYIKHPSCSVNEG